MSNKTQAEETLNHIANGFGLTEEESVTFFDSIRSMASNFKAIFHKYVKFFATILDRIKTGLTKDVLLKGDVFAIAKQGGLI